MLNTTRAMIFRIYIVTKKRMKQKDPHYLHIVCFLGKPCSEKDQHEFAGINSRHNHRSNCTIAKRRKKKKKLIKEELPDLQRSKECAQLPETDEEEKHLQETSYGTLQ